ILYFGLHGLDSSDSANKGELLDPVQPLPALELNGADGHTTSDQVLREKWTYLQVAPAECGAACREGLQKTRQIRALLHKKRDRVQRVLLVGGAMPKFEDQPALEIYSGELEPLVTMIEAHAAGQPGTVYLIDPHGNWVLFYPPGQDGEGLYRDTKRLLRLSQIG